MTVHVHIVLQKLLSEKNMQKKENVILLQLIYFANNLSRKSERKRYPPFEEGGLPV